jgi:hypothetical protein
MYVLSISNYVSLIKLSTARPKNWLLDKGLTGKRFKLIIKGTKVPPRFKGGEYEGNIASFWHVEERDIVKVHLLPWFKPLSIPCKFLEPFGPSDIGEQVICIRGEKTGNEYVVRKIFADQFSLANSLAPTVEITTLPKRFLAVCTRAPRP